MSYCVHVNIYIYYANITSQDNDRVLKVEWGPVWLCHLFVTTVISLYQLILVEWFVKSSQVAFNKNNNWQSHEFDKHYVWNAVLGVLYLVALHVFVNW